MLKHIIWGKASPFKGKRNPSKIVNYAPMGSLFFTKEARIYNEAKTASSINGSRKTGQL